MPSLIQRGGIVTGLPGLEGTAGDCAPQSGNVVAGLWRGWVVSQWQALAQVVSLWRDSRGSRGWRGAARRDEIATRLGIRPSVWCHGCARPRRGDVVAELARSVAVGE
jgi:hypothetical protein